MSRPPVTNRAPTKDMYWFAHGGVEFNTDKCLNQRQGEGEEESSDAVSPTFRSLTDRRVLSDDIKSPVNPNAVVDSTSSSGPSSLELKEERSRNLEKRMAAEERRKQLWEAEQERNDAVLRKHLEREAALEARRNASRSNISFAFGSSVPRNVESLAGGDSDRLNRNSNASGLIQKDENHETVYSRRSVSPFYSSGYRLEVDSPRPHSPQIHLNNERKTLSPPCWLVGSGALIGGDDIMSRSMTAAVPAPRGRRKNDLMPTVPYDRTPTPKTSSSCSTRKRSVSMTRLDQLAQPRKHYVEANKASSTVSSGASSMLKDTIKSPTRPLSSASEQSGHSGRLASSTVRRVRSSPRKPRPVSIAGTVPDHRTLSEAKTSPEKRTFHKRLQIEAKKTTPVNGKQPSAKPAPRVTSAPKPAKQSTSTPKPTKQPPQPKSSSSPKTPTSKKTVTNKKKADIMVSSQTASAEVTASQPQESVKASSPPDSPPPESAASEANNTNKRIISEEEAKAALAEKRKLAREQAEKEAELERQRQEELRRQEEEQLRLEEEEQKKMEEEQLRLLEEHRKVEEEKLRKAIEENERKEEEERLKREEELRLKAEQEKKAQEDAEKQRIELEEKLRKEEEERAERKKRLEKIMSRTRGKTTGSSPSGSVSGSEQLDSSENQQENFSSGANSLDSNPGAELTSGPASLETQQGKSDPISDGASMEAHPTYEVASDNESLHDIVMPKSETASQDNSLVILAEKDDFKTSESIVAPQLDDDETSQLKNIVAPVTGASQFEAVASVIEVSRLENDVAPIAEAAWLEIDNSVPNADFSNSDVNIFEDENMVSTEIVRDVCDLSDANRVIVNENNIVEDDVDGFQISDKVEEMVVPTSAASVEAIPAAVILEPETAAVDHSEVILSFDNVSDEYSNDTADVILPDVGQPPEHIEADNQQNSHFSTSSDIKLPDPIYETTSDEGSVSSEKQQQDGGHFEFQEEEQHHESQLMSDDVFDGKEIQQSEGSNFNPFDNQDFASSSASNLMAAYESQFDLGGMQASIYEYETSEVCLPDAAEQPKEVGEETICTSRLSSSSSADINVKLDSKLNTDVIQNVDENKENMEDVFALQQSNPFSVSGNEFDAFSNKENVQLIPDSAINNDTCITKVLPENPNVDMNEMQAEDNFVLQQKSLPEQINIENQSTFNESSIEGFESNITFIKAEGSDDCIGIVSSIDHDHISNDLVIKQCIQNEQLKSNFEYSSITDSEDSSLDSNLSQVMSGEVSEKNSVALNGSSESAALINNPFSEPALNGNSDSKSNGDHHFSNKEILSNGHKFESSPSTEQMCDFAPLVDGKHISSVDHPSSNIFDNVDAVEFGKISPDPFLAKGNSNQIPGNPFLLQDDKKQVLMTPDFFN